MTPSEVAEIFTAANAACEILSSTPTYTDIDRFDEEINTILVELPRDHDGDEFRMLYLRQDPNEYNKITVLYCEINSVQDWLVSVCLMNITHC